MELVLNKNAGEHCIVLDEMPWWRGVQPETGDCEVSEFVLLARPGEPIRQDVTKVGRELARIYSEDKYQFITTPPGGSAWANRLITEKLGFFLSETEIISAEADRARQPDTNYGLYERGWSGEQLGAFGTF